MSFALSSFHPVIKEPPWVTAWKLGTEWWLRWVEVNLEEHRKQVTAKKADEEALRRMVLQSQVAGCRKTRSERWNNAHFLRWIEYHAAAFDVVYGKLTSGISVPAARSFVRNFYYTEYLIAKRHRVLMEDWNRLHRDKLCELLRGNDHLFSRVRRLHRLSRRSLRTFMDELDSTFSRMLNVET